MNTSASEFQVYIIQNHALKILLKTYHQNDFFDNKQHIGGFVYRLLHHLPDLVFLHAASSRDLVSMPDVLRNRLCPANSRITYQNMFFCQPHRQAFLGQDFRFFVKHDCYTFSKLQRQATGYVRVCVFTITKFQSLTPFGVDYEQNCDTILLFYNTYSWQGKRTHTCHSLLGNFYANNEVYLLFTCIYCFQTKSMSYFILVS